MANLNYKFLGPEFVELVNDLVGRPYKRGKKLVGSIGAFRARVFYALGHPTGKKATKLQVFPRYIELALETLQMESATPAERKIAEAVIEDFVLAFFYADKVKPMYKGSKNGVGHLSSSRYPDVADMRLDGFKDALFLSRRGIEPYRSAINRSKDGRVVRYSPRMYFGPDEMEGIEYLREEFKERVIAAAGKKRRRGR